MAAERYRDDDSLWPRRNPVYADTANGLCGCCQNGFVVPVQHRTLTTQRLSVRPYQCLRWQFSEQIAVPGRKATQLRNVPSMCCNGYRTSDLSFRDEFVAYSMQP